MTGRLVQKELEMVIDDLLMTEDVCLRVKMSFLRYCKTPALDTHQQMLLMYGPRECGEDAVAAYIAHILRVRLFTWDGIESFASVQAHATEDATFAVLFIPSLETLLTNSRITLCELIQYTVHHRRVVLIIHTTTRPCDLGQHPCLRTMFLDIPPDSVRLQCIARVLSTSEGSIESVATWLCDVTGPSDAIDRIVLVTRHLKRRQCLTRTGLHPVGYALQEVIRILDTMLRLDVYDVRNTCLVLLREVSPISMVDYVKYVDYFRHGQKKYITTKAIATSERRVQRILDESTFR
jgi:hypothetical protein